MRSSPLKSFLRTPWREGDWPLLVSSIGESQIIDLVGAEDDLAPEIHKMQQHTLTRLGRVYPKGTRITSTNPDPLQSWRGGVQAPWG